MMSEQELYKPHSLTDKKEYTKYIKAINPKHKIVGRDNYFRFVKEFFDTIAIETLERDGGVFVKNLGYFFNWLCPRKLIWSLSCKDEDYYSVATNNRQYFPTYIPPSSRCEWTMDKAFSKTYKKKLGNNIEAGKRYKTYYTSLKRTKWV